jgi:hypothetical protein
MTKIRFAYNNLWRKGTIYNKTDQHPQYPWEDTQLDTPSQFGRTRYGAGSGNGTFVVTDSNKYVDFDEGGAELTGTLVLGTYNGLTYAAAIATAMNAAPGKALTYAGAYNETTSKFTISAGSNFTIRWNTGTHKATDISDTAGYSDAANDSGAASYTSDYRRIHWPAVYFDNDLGGLNDLNIAGLINHNISSAATISLIMSTTSDFSSGNTTETLTYNAYAIFKFFTLVNKRYVRIKIEDPTNPNSYIQVGPVWTTKYIEPSRTFSGDGYEDGGDDPSDIEFTPAGVLCAQERSFIDAVNIVFNRLEATSKNEIRALIEEVGLTRSLLAIFDYSQPNTTTMLARLNEVVYPAYAGSSKWSWSCSLKEII